jgi:predicted alpha/beta superfamily hydrolase
VRRLPTVLLGLLVSSAATPCADARGFTVRLSVDMRSERAAKRFDPTTDGVGVRGGRAPLSWSSSVPMSDPDGDGIYDASLTFADCGGCNPVVSYKFKIERRARPDEGWEAGPNRPLVACGGPSAVGRVFDSPPVEFPHTQTGDVRTHEKFASRYVTARDVFVLLPRGYDREPARRYPVLYMHDGQNLFDAARAFSSEWCVDETTGRLEARRAIEPVIVVGVANTPDRIGDYTPTEIARDVGGVSQRIGGHDDRYGKFLVEELKPFVDRAYRTKPDRASTALGGSSLGGLVSLDLGLAYPDVFGKLLVVSPSIWWDDELIVKRVRSLATKPATAIWLDMGTKEDAEAIAQARRLRDALVAKGWRVGRDLAYTEAAGAGHDESAWSARFEAMMRFLYPVRSAKPPRRFR